MALFYESHHLIILGLPSFVLCHIKEIDAANIVIFIETNKKEKKHLDMTTFKGVCLICRL